MFALGLCQSFKFILDSSGGKPILPKAEFKEGRLIATHCPECNAELDKIERPPKTTFFTWLIAILAALIVGVVVYGIFEPNF